jgi:Cu-Zn family superoxide dismutase
MNNCAVAVFTTPGIKGNVHFIDRGNYRDIILDLTGLKQNGKHGFHIHTYGDLTEGCKSACDHFNPFNSTHGCPGMSNRHIGDLGNIQTDLFGNAKYVFSDNMISLRPGDPCCIIGRMLIIHENEDDCGMGTGDARAESLITGNAGKRIACAVIGFSK